MSVRYESSSRPADARPVALAAALGLVVFTAAWAALHVGFYERDRIVDTPVYQEYGEAILDGRLPYRDFAVEYPPAALPAFVLPALAPGDSYVPAFEVAMWACGGAAVVFVALALGAVGARPARLYAAVAFVALAPLALGSVVLSRYDLWPAALAAAAVAALVAGRGRLGLGLLAVAVAAKVYPLVLLPPALLFLGRARGAREAAVALAVFTAVLAAITLPFALAAPEGVGDSLARQLGRPLQLESLGASLLLAAEQVGLYEAEVVSTHGSQNLRGRLPDALAAVQTALQALALAALWGVYALRRADGPGRFLAVAAASVAAFVAFGKVLSPQFLIWLVPLVPLVGGATGLAGAAVLVSALVTTQLWFPYRYWDVVALEAAGWLVLVRNLLLVALVAVLAVAIRRVRAAPRSA